MKVLLLTLEPPLDPARVCTGNQVRADHLKRGLEHHGIEVRQAFKDERSADDRFSDAPGLAALLDSMRPDALLVGYWKLLELLPESPGVPVAVDCVAPRSVERHFEDPAGTRVHLQRMTEALARADRILVGNRRQSHLMVGWLLMAGLDLRGKSPVLVLPPSCDPPAEPRTEPPEHWRLVGGGRAWPWREAGPWLQALAEAAQDAPVTVEHVGEDDERLPAGVQRLPLMAHDEWRRYLAERAHVGLELADDNLERRLSQSFRAAACLEAGLPLMLNDYLALAGAVRRFDAGWAVADRAQAAQAVRELLRSPETWLPKARGAWRLAREELDFRHTVAPLARWAAQPERARRVPKAAAAQRQSDRHATGWRDQTLRALARALVAPFRRRVSGDGVVVVTRSDLFPAHHGAAVKIVETARALAATGRSVAVVTSERHRCWVVRDGTFHELRLPAWLRWLAPPQSMVNLLTVLAGVPAGNAFLYWPLRDPFHALRAAWVGRRIGACCYLAEFPAYVQAARVARALNGGTVVLVEHNVEYARMREQVAELGDAQFEKLKRWELDWCRRADAVICVSERDRDRLTADGANRQRITVIPHGVDAAGLGRAVPADLGAEFELDPARPVLVYHGTYLYPPNAQAAETVVEELMPRLSRLGHDVQFLGIGANPPPMVTERAVCMPGGLNDLGPALRACDVAVVPLSHGGGTRMKILDYFAAGLPVVTTTKGCEGISVRDGREVLIRDDWDGFADAVAELLSDRDKAAALGARSRALAESLDWPRIGRRYDALLGRLSA